MGRDNRNEMSKVHRKKGRTLEVKLKLIREKLGIKIYPQQWGKISLPQREHMLRQVFPERYTKPQPPAPPAAHPAAAPPPQPATPASTEQKS